MARNDEPAADAGPDATDASAAPDREAIAVAINTYSRDVYVVEGPNAQSYPIRFDQVRGGDGDLVVSGQVDEVHKKTLGFRFFGALLSEPGGEELRGLVEDLRENDEDLLDVMERRLEALDE